jgi:putative toxin-antitoxin system antitoxin component (TIGR02293 family)
MYAEPQAVADVLGLSERRKATPFELIRSIMEGFPVSSVEHLAEVIAPANVEFKHSLVPKATLSRRKQSQKAKLTTQQSDRLARIAKVWTHALDVWKDEAAARAFLFRAHPMLEGQKPMEVALATEVGADLVDQILGRLAYGSAA